MMPDRSDVFDADQVLYDTRRRVVRLGRVAIGAGILTVGLVALWLNLALPLPSLGCLLALLWLGETTYSTRRLRKLRRVVWCLKLSSDAVEGYDYARRHLQLAWKHVQRVELTDAGLRVVGDPHPLIEIPDAFVHYSALSHRVVHYAERQGVPIWIDGQPYEEIDVYALFPSLAEGPSSDAPNRPHGSAAA